jgi:basic amino acid/polyamine antiporter, APA family
MSLFRKKSIEHMLAGAQRAGLKKTLGALDLTFLGVGARRSANWPRGSSAGT